MHVIRDAAGAPIQIAAPTMARRASCGRPPMFLCDTGSLAFMAVNESAIACYGYDKNSFLALTLLDIVPPERQG